jgi:peptidyl-dipeptidase Dcp
MKYTIYLIILTMGLSNFQVEAQELKPIYASNPFLNSYKTPFYVPPFHLIKNEHYKPATQE